MSSEEEMRLRLGNDYFPPIGGDMPPRAQATDLLIRMDQAQLHAPDSHDEGPQPPSETAYRDEEDFKIF